VCFWDAVCTASSMSASVAVSVSRHDGLNGDAVGGIVIMHLEAQIFSIV